MKTLTSLQEGILRQIVQAVRKGELTEEFRVHFPMGPPGTHELIATDGKGIKLDHPAVTSGVFAALAEVESVVCFQEQGSTLRCVLLGKAFELVDTNFNHLHKIVQEHTKDTQLPIKPLDQSIHEYLQYLHPYIQRGCVSLFITGHYTQAIEESTKAVFEYIRQKTGLAIDGTSLAERVFSPKNPILRLNDLSTQTEQDEQQGFMELLKGYYKGVRNPLVHTHGKQADQQIAFEYIVMASLFCRRIDETSPNIP